MNQSDPSLSKKTTGEHPSLASTLKSLDTEETLDLIFYRPIGYAWALLCSKLGIVPNAVTIAAIIIGAAGGLFFAFDTLRFTIWGIVLIVLANSLDSADGQLARMTGKHTRLGRILDGMCGDIWFIFIYIAIIIRLQHQGWQTIYAFTLCAVTGLIHAQQAGLADYYRNLHLFVLKGTQYDEWNNTTQLKKAFKELPWWPNIFAKLIALLYWNYTRIQESFCPNLQRLRHALYDHYGQEWPESFRNAFRAKSKPLMKYTNILSFNTRIIVLFITLLLNAPLYYLLFELTVMNIILLYMRFRHERICRHFLKQLDATTL